MYYNVLLADRSPDPNHQRTATYDWSPMVHLTSFGHRLGQRLSRLYAESRARRGEPDPNASGPWARASLDTASGLLLVVLESSGANQVRLRHSIGSLTVELERIDAGTHQLPLGAIKRYGTVTPLRTGAWHLEAATTAGWLPVLALAPTKGTVSDAAAGVNYRLLSTPSGLEIHSVAQPYFDQRWRPVQSYRAALVPRRAERRPLKRAVVYECFWGRQVSGNPRALIEPLRQRLPGVAEYWVIDPGSTYAPAGMKALVRWSSEWHMVLASAGLVVTNAALPDHFRRRDGQVVLQTWHGTPLKRLGLDMLTFEHMSPAYAETLRIASAQWSLLLAPNKFCSEVYPGAFAYGGSLLEVGSPRNDALSNGTQPARLEQIRSGLGIEMNRRVVLVAPTFRDGAHSAGGAAAAGHIDLDRLCEALGDGVTVLFRAHNWVSATDAPMERDNLLNVSDYPDIADLYQVADLLVTDYSSVMFDFAVTGRPMVFHTPDLEHYRDELRGWYFDLQAVAPGPITRTADELSAAIAHGLAVGAPGEYAERYEAFVQRFNAWERGDASQRVADALVKASVFDAVSPKDSL